MKSIAVATVGHVAPGARYTGHGPMTFTLNGQAQMLVMAGVLVLNPAVGSPDSRLASIGAAHVP